MKDISLREVMSEMSTGGLIMIPQTYYADAFYLDEETDCIYSLSSGEEVEDLETISLLFENNSTRWLTSRKDFIEDSRAAFDEYFDEDEFEFQPRNFYNFIKEVVIVEFSGKEIEDEWIAINAEEYGFEEGIDINILPNTDNNNEVYDVYVYKIDKEEKNVRMQSAIVLTLEITQLELDGNNESRR